MKVSALIHFNISSQPSLSSLLRKIIYVKCLSICLPLSQFLFQDYTLLSVYEASWVNSSVCVQSLSHVFLFVAPWTIAHQASLSMEFSRQEYLYGLPFSAPGDLPKPGMEPIAFVSPALAGKLFSTVPLRSLNSSVTSSNSEILLLL